MIPQISCGTFQQSFCLRMIFTTYFQVVAVWKLKWEGLPLSKFASQDVKWMAYHNLGTYFIIIDLASNVQEFRAKAEPRRRRFAAAGSIRSLVLSAFYRNLCLGQTAAETSWFWGAGEESHCLPFFILWLLHASGITRVEGKPGG